MRPLPPVKSLLPGLPSGCNIFIPKLERDFQVTDNSYHLLLL